MIDRGALLLARQGSYRGLSRTPLDGLPVATPAQRAVVERYRVTVIEGDGVVDDLDDAVALRDESHHAGWNHVEVVVFEVVAERGAGRLPVAPEAPAEGLAILGYDVVEAMEPFWSPLANGTDGVNDDGLFATESAARAWLSERAPSEDEPLRVARVWIAV